MTETLPTAAQAGAALKPAKPARPVRPAKPVKPAADIRGLVDNVTADRIYGWAFDAGQASRRLRVELRLAGETVAATVADLPRPDLAVNGIGDGCHAFEFALSPDLWDRRGEVSVAVIGDAGDEVTIPVRHHVSPPQLRGAMDKLGAEQQRLKEALRDIGEHVAQLPDAELVQQALAQQEELDKRLGALEVWIARLDRRLAEVPNGPVPVRRRFDAWQVALFMVLVLACIAGLGVAFYLQTK